MSGRATRQAVAKIIETLTPLSDSPEEVRAQLTALVPHWPSDGPIKRAVTEWLSWAIAHYQAIARQPIPSSREAQRQFLALKRAGKRLELAIERLDPHLVGLYGLDSWTDRKRWLAVSHEVQRAPEPRRSGPRYQYAPRELVRMLAQLVRALGRRPTSTRGGQLDMIVAEAFEAVGIPAYGDRDRSRLLREIVTGQRRPR